MIKQRGHGPRRAASGLSSQAGLDPGLGSRQLGRQVVGQLLKVRIVQLEFFHPGCLVDVGHGHRSTRPQLQAGLLETLDRARTMVGPHHVGEQAELAVEVDAVRCDEPVREQMQPQVDVVGVDGGGGDVGDRRADRDDLDAARLVGADQGFEVGGDVGEVEDVGAGGGDRG